MALPNDNATLGFLTEQDVRRGVERVCKRFDVTLKDFLYSIDELRPSSRLFFDGDYVALPQPHYALHFTPGHPETYIYPTYGTVLIRVVSGESEKTFSLFTMPETWTPTTIDDYFEPRVEEWIVDLMTGRAS